MGDMKRKAKALFAFIVRIALLFAIWWSIISWIERPWRMPAQVSLILAAPFVLLISRRTGPNLP
jgi:hypothetical protein